jgi:hypothetical protein
MYNLKDMYIERVGELNTGEYGEQFENYGSGYIDDIIAEIADSK